MGGPYAPTVAGLGGQPTKKLDDPITSVFLVLFLFGAIAHMTILQVNRKRGQKFLMSGMLFGFCFSRIVSTIMRLVWSTHLDNVSVAIAAQIFVAAGVVLLFVINLIFTQRIIRAVHPHFAWAKWFSIVFKLYYASIIALLIALITATVDSFFTLNPDVRRKDRIVQLVGSTYFAVAAFVPIILLLITVIIPKQSRVEKFGQGRFRTKIYVLIFSSLILTLGAAFRAGIAYVPRPVTDPAWYHSKACFYIFDFTIEITVVYLYVFLRVDKRFIIPDGSHKAGDYSRRNVDLERKSSLAERVNSEEEVFDDEVETDAMPRSERRDLEAQGATRL